MIKNIFKYLFLYLFGGLIYILIELFYRGFSHYSMFLLGGLCFIMLGLLNEFITWNTNIIFQSLIGGFLIVTPLEFIFGLFFNNDYSVWDYRSMPLNIMGQICLPFSLLWCLLGLVGIMLDDYLRYWLFGEDQPHYKLF